MWKSNILIVIDPKNVDRNSVSDLASAVQEAGAEVIVVDDQRLVIEAAVSTTDVPLIAAMDGVSYVRSVFSYFCNQSSPQVA